MEKQKLLSIVIPTYNRGNLITYTLSLFEEQVLRYRDEVELIVCDNLSSDNTCIKVDEYYKYHPYFRFVKYHDHAEVGDSLVRSVENAKGQFFVIFGDDDLPSPFLVDAWIYYLRKFPNIGMLLCNRLRGCSVEETGGIEDIKIDGLSRYEQEYTYYESCSEFIKQHIHAIGFISIVIIRKEAWDMRMKDVYPNNHIGWNYYVPYVYSVARYSCLYVSYPCMIRRIPPKNAASVHNWNGKESAIFLVGKARVLKKLNELGLLSDWTTSYNRYIGNTLDILILLLRSGKNGVLAPFADELCGYQSIARRRKMCERIMKTNGIINRFWMLWYKSALFFSVRVLHKQPINQKYLYPSFQILNFFRCKQRKGMNWRNPFHKIRYRNVSLPNILTNIQHINNKGYCITHISAFDYGNKGDLLLPIVLRRLFEECIGVSKWHNGHVHNVVDALDVSLMNSDDCVIIGGGGLFLKDTNPNMLSGWQWSCNIDNLQRIKKPLILFAVGYNRFRGQDDFEPIFTEHINALVRKASFVGLRNHGSIEKICGYLKSQDLKDKLCYQPCMTTLISKLYPKYVDYNKKEDFIAVNCAYDRDELRADTIVQYDKIARVIKHLSTFTKIKIYVHVLTDKKILRSLTDNAVNFEIIEFSSADDMIYAYSKPRLVIGMRGHAQMIPFGCHTPILSIVSHDKMQWFLDDIHHPEWGVELNDNEFEDKLYAKAKAIYDNYQDAISEIETEQDLLWDITMQNMRKIKDIIEKK